MNLANEAAELAIDVSSHEPDAATALNVKAGELLSLAVNTNGEHRETAFRLACALMDFSDVWKEQESEVTS